jgi:hypothetical protein
MPDNPETEGQDAYREKLRSITERIQVGDTDEGAAALEEAMAIAVDAGGRNRAAIRETMREEMVTAWLQAENVEALKTFGKRYGPGNPLMGEAAEHALRDEIATDLKAIGIPDEAIAPLRGNTGAMVGAHTEARAKGRQVRKPDDLVGAVGKTLERELNLRPIRPRPGEYVASLRAQRGLPNREQRGEPVAASDYGRDRESDDFGSLEGRRARVRAMREARGFPTSR